MKIYRQINGVNFCIELLPNEMVEAYFEQQGKFDVEDIVSFAETFSNSDLEKIVDSNYSDILANKEEIAKRMRKYIDNYNMEFSYAREEAIRDVMAEHKVTN